MIFLSSLGLLMTLNGFKVRMIMLNSKRVGGYVHCCAPYGDLISPSKWVQTILCWLSGSSTDQLVLFGYAQTALNADATFKFHPQNYDKGLLPTILPWVNENDVKTCI